MTAYGPFAGAGVAAGAAGGGALAPGAGAAASGAGAPRTPDWARLSWNI